MKVLTVRIQLPEGRNDETSYTIVMKRFLKFLFAGSEWLPKGTAMAVYDETGAQLHRHGSFSSFPPDEESAAEEKGDLKREGDR